MTDDGDNVTEPARRLRLAHLAIQPVFVWDDGESLLPGPQVQPVILAPGGVPELLASLAEQTTRLEAEALAPPEPA